MFQNPTDSFCYHFRIDVYEILPFVETRFLEYSGAVRC